VSEISAPTGDAAAPRLVPWADGHAPRAPVTVGETGINSAVLADLALKAAYSVPSFTTEWSAQRLRLPIPIVQELLEQLRVDRLVEVLGQAGPFGYRFTVTQRGREHAGRLMEISGYVGPAPVSLADYGAMLEWQLANLPPVAPEEAQAALADLVLTPEAVQVAGLASASGRSLFVFGPPGNGKSSLSRALHVAQKGALWVPHCIAIESNIIRVFDPQSHQPLDSTRAPAGQLDGRWVHIRRPLIMVGGELTLEAFDLTYSPSVRYYEAPLHFKANGGLFLIDDFGRERIEPHELVNRWITPLEHKIDFLTLHTGQKIQVPLQLMLILATNLSLEKVTDPAFLRRLGYRLYLGEPSPEQYASIFERYAAGAGAVATAELISWILERYRAEGKELRCCEPRDLIERARDVCRYRGQAFRLDQETLELAWTGYFGNGYRSRRGADQYLGHGAVRIDHGAENDTGSQDQLVLVDED
jgi:hypothetical protein